MASYEPPPKLLRAFETVVWVLIGLTGVFVTLLVCLLLLLGVALLVGWLAGLVT